MDLKTYEKTRYQNIYRHIKNKNYVIQMSKPVKTTISRIDNNKIYRLEDALKIRDNPKIKVAKATETLYKDDFDTLWYKYITECKQALKQAYNTYHKKEKLYNKYFKGKFHKPLSKLNKTFFALYIDKLNTSDKQKNEILKCLKVFFNWCIENEYLISNPIIKIKPYKIPKQEMKYWTPSEIKQFFDGINKEIEHGTHKEVAYRVKMLVLIGFSLGDRIGETRALKYSSINANKKTILINRSINYDSSDENNLSSTKTYGSQREINISDKLIEEINKYRYFLVNDMSYNVKDDDLIFYNYRNNKPFSDNTLRNLFYKYCDYFNVSKIRLYDLRHTYVATMMQEEKELYLISEKIGHTSYSTTVNKYGHLSNQIKKEIAEVTDKYI